MTEIIVALITGMASVAAVVITNNKNNRDILHKLDNSQAITEVKIQELTHEVRRHNDFAERIPTLAEQMKEVNRRIETLEKYHRGN